MTGMETKRARGKCIAKCAGLSKRNGLRQRELVSTPRLAITLGHNYVDVNLHIAAHVRMIIAL